MEHIIHLSNKIEKLYEKYQNSLKLCLILSFSLVVVWYGKYSIEEDIRYYDLYESASSISVTEIFKEEDIIQQEFLASHSSIDEIKIKFATHNSVVSNGKIEVKILDEQKNIVEEQIIEAKKILDNQYLPIKLTNTNKFNIGKIYIIQLKFIDIKDETIVCHLSDNNIYKERLIINQVVQPANLVMSYGTTSRDLFENMYLFISTCFIILIILVYIVIYKKQVEWSKIYLVIGLLFGLLYQIMIPVYAVPDELAHVYSAYSVSNHLLGIENTETGSIYMRNDDVHSIIRARGIDREYYNLYYTEISNFFIDNEELIETTRTPLNTVSYSYWLSGIGLTIGRLLKFNTIPAFLMGRIFNMLFFIACVYYAIKKIPFGKVLLFIWALLPMTLQQASSYSYDVIILAMSVLIVSLSLKLAYQETSKKSEWLILFIAAMLMVPTKQFAIIPLAFVPFIIYFKKWKDGRQVLYYTLGIALGIVLIVTGIKVSSKLMVEPSINENAQNIIEWANEEGYTLDYLFQNLDEFLYIICNTIYQRADFYFASTLGSSLGWFEVTIPLMIVMPYFILMIIAAMKKKGEQVYLGRKIKIYLTLLGALGCGFACAGMLLGWTPISYSTIEGVQGRYFLPFVVLLLLCIRSENIEVKKEVDNKLIFSSIWLQLLITVALHIRAI